MGYHIRPEETTPIFDEVNLKEGYFLFVMTRDDIDWGDYWLPTLGRRPVSLPNM